jgi:Predicted transcriptional regulators
MESINRKLSISEMAQIHDISRQTLIYYDKIGLFQPDFVDKETGYRYYSTMQIPLLREICFLRSIGMPLDEIQQHNQINNSTTTITLLKSQNEKIKKKIAELQFQQQQIEKRVKIYQDTNNYAHDQYKPYIESFPERRMLYYPWHTDTHTRTELHYALMRIWNISEKLGYLPGRRWGAIIFKDSIMAKDPLHKAGGCVLIADNLVQNHPPIEEPAKLVTLTAGDYVCIPKFGMPYDTSHIYKILQWIEDNGYEVTGDIYDECLLDAIFYGSDRELDFCEIQVPIRKKETREDL